MKRSSIGILGCLLICIACPTLAGNPLFGEIDLRAASKVEKNAGVWLDGQYLGHLRELRGRSQLVLPPGEHQLLFRLIGYQELQRDVTIEPGQSHEINVSLIPDASAVYPDETQLAELKLSVDPEQAAIFVNGTYAGFVDQFNGSRGMQLGPGVYELRIALPGYDTFETSITIAARQSYEIKTKLPKTSIQNQSDGLILSQALD